MYIYLIHSNLTLKKRKNICRISLAEKSRAVPKGSRRKKFWSIWAACRFIERLSRSPPYSSHRWYKLMKSNLIDESMMKKIDTEIERIHAETSPHIFAWFFPLFQVYQFRSNDRNNLLLQINPSLEGITNESVDRFAWSDESLKENIVQSPHSNWIKFKTNLFKHIFMARFQWSSVCRNAIQMLAVLLLVQSYWEVYRTVHFAYGSASVQNMLAIVDKFSGTSIQIVCESRVLICAGLQVRPNRRKLKIQTSRMFTIDQQFGPRLPTLLNLGGVE